MRARDRLPALNSNCKMHAVIGGNANDRPKALDPVDEVVELAASRTFAIAAYYDFGRAMEIDDAEKVKECSSLLSNIIPPVVKKELEVIQDYLCRLSR